MKYNLNFGLTGSMRGFGSPHLRIPENNRDILPKPILFSRRFFSKLLKAIVRQVTRINSTRIPIVQPRVIDTPPARQRGVLKKGVNQAEGEKVIAKV
jgi:hypothetical protein